MNVVYVLIVDFSFNFVTIYIKRKYINMLFETQSFLRVVFINSFFDSPNGCELSGGLFDIRFIEKIIVEISKFASDSDYFFSFLFEVYSGRFVRDYNSRKVKRVSDRNVFSVFEMRFSVFIIKQIKIRISGCFQQFSYTQKTTLMNV